MTRHLLTLLDCSTKKCMLVLSFITDGSTTKFLFEADGRIKHAETEMCLVFGNDTFGDYDELILLADCEHPASRWTMWSYPEKGLFHASRENRMTVKLPKTQSFAYNPP